MVTSALVLIAAILLLGGSLAALGDYLGSKVGKARLRIFNLRPRQTATLVTITTGTLIAASTFGLLLATSESLRKGIFRIDEYLNRLQDTHNELSRSMQEKRAVEKELEQAQERLDDINRKFEVTQGQLERVSEQLSTARKELASLKNEKNELLAQREKLEEQIIRKDEELAQQEKQREATKERLQALEREQNQLQQEIEQQDDKIAQFDRMISQRDGILQSKEKQVRGLEEEVTTLQNQIQALEQYYENYQALREGNVALVKGEVLAFSVVKIDNPAITEAVIEEILKQANRKAIKATQPGNEAFNQEVITMSQSQINRLKDILQTGREYVVQIVTSGNYLNGEKKISVFADVVLNQKVFDRGEIIASLPLNPQEVKAGKLSERINLLIASSQFRARRSGIVGQILVGENQLEVIRFMEELASLNQSYDQINTIVAQTAYTSGPLRLKLTVMGGNKVILTN